MDMLSDGELYRMQQEAIKRAQETARLSPEKNKKHSEQRKEAQNGFSLKRISEMLNLKSKDSLIITGVILLLLSNGCEDEILILALLFLLIKN